MLRFLDSGESHGQALVTLIEGMPAGLPLSSDQIDRDLARRQAGYGRGGRMKIESDLVRILSGVRFGLTLGSPIALEIPNRDAPNWTREMSVSGAGSDSVPITRPRPGHADLAGALKYGTRDIRNVLERASARETATRVAVGAVARRLLEEFGVSVFSNVLSVGGVTAPSPCLGAGGVPWAEVVARSERSPVRCWDERSSDLMMNEIDRAKALGDSLGGVFEVVAVNVPPGLGSHVHWDRRLDGRLAGAMMSVQAIKGVEVGLGFEAARRPGSRVHDEVTYSPVAPATGSFGPGSPAWYSRPTNNAGGLEGGITTGAPVVVRAAMKPIPTLRKPLLSVDMITKEAVEASFERSDVCAVPAAAVVGEAAVVFELAAALLEKLGGDSLNEMKIRFERYLEYLRSR